MDFAMIKKLVRGNGEKLILMENGEPEAVVMSFGEYARLAGAGAGAASTANAAPAGATSISASSSISARPFQEPEVRHATEERFDMPLPPHEENENYEFESWGEQEPVFDEPPKPLARDMAVRLADIRLEDLPI